MSLSLKIAITAALAIASGEPGWAYAQTVVASGIFRGLGQANGVAASADVLRRQILVWDASLRERRTALIRDDLDPGDVIIVADGGDKVIWVERSGDHRRLVYLDAETGDEVRHAWDYGSICSSYALPGRKAFGLNACSGPLVEFSTKGQLLKIYPRTDGALRVVGSGGVLDGGVIRPFGSPNPISVDLSGFPTTDILSSDRFIIAVSAGGRPVLDVQTPPREWEKIIVFNATDGSVAARMPFRSDFVISAATHSLDGAFIYLGFSTGVVEKRRLPDLSLIWRQTAPQPVEKLAIQPERLLVKSATQIMALPL